MINTTYQNYGIFSCPKPDINELKNAISLYKIKTILSLDETAGNEVKALIEKYKLPVKQIIQHISPFSPNAGGQVVFNNILNYLEDKPVLIHCQQGKDRTGFAIASYLVKKGIMNAPTAIADVTKNVGYGTGISEPVKNTLDRILGYIKSNKDKNKLDDKNIVNFDGGIIPTGGELNVFPAMSQGVNNFSLLNYVGNERPLGSSSSVRRGKLLKIAGIDKELLLEEIGKEEDPDKLELLLKAFDDLSNSDLPTVGESSNYDGVPYTHLSGPSATPGGSSSVSFVEKAEPGGVVQI